MLQQYGRGQGVGQGLYGATAPSVAANPTPTVGVANSGISSGALDVSGATKGSQLGYGNRVASKKKQRGEVGPVEQPPLAGLGGGTMSGTGSSRGGNTLDTPENAAAKAATQTPALATALSNSPVLAQARGTLAAQAQQAGPKIGESTGATTPAAPAAAASRSNVPMSAGVPIYEKDRNEYNLHPGGPGYAGSAAERINLQNPTGRADLPYAQGGTNGGWIDGIGETISAGRSITPALALQQRLQALQQGVPASFMQGFLQANKGDTNRLIEAYRSENEGSGIGQGSWQNFTLPSEEEARAYFAEQAPAGGGGSQAPAPAGPSREEIEAEIRAKIEAENKAKADEEAKKAAEEAEYKRTHPRGALPGENKKKK